MKLVYEKPMMAVERYVLTQSIATCVTKIGFLDTACVLKDDDSTNEMINLADQKSYFISGCQKTPSENEGSNGICYHTNANAAFNS